LVWIASKNLDEATEGDTARLEIRPLVGSAMLPEHGSACSPRAEEAWIKSPLISRLRLHWQAGQSLEGTTDGARLEIPDELHHRNYAWYKPRILLMKLPSREIQMGSQRGVTLLELLMVVTILAIVATIGVPGLRELVLANRQNGAINELVASFQLARSDAITFRGGAAVGGGQVAICPSADADADSCGEDWSLGWIVFRDNDGDSDLGAADEILRITAPQPGLDITSTADMIQYRRDGRASTAAQLTFCDSRGDRAARRVALDFSGRVSTFKPPASSCD